MSPDCASQINVMDPSLLHYSTPSTPPVAPPDSLSSLGLSVAKKGDLSRGMALCREALSRSPQDPIHYLHLGKVYLLAKKKHLALHSFRKGLKYGYHRGLVSEIQRLGFRSPPVFPFLGRKHFLNRFVGILFTHLGLR